MSDGAAVFGVNFDVKCMCCNFRCKMEWGDEEIPIYIEDGKLGNDGHRGRSNGKAG